VLSNDARRRILVALADGPLNVSTVAKRAGMTTTNASVNLGTLSTCE
jgi:predicted transcriptional regulator